MYQGKTMLPRTENTHKIWFTALLALIFITGCGNPDRSTKIPDPTPPTVLSMTPPTVISVAPSNGANGACPTAVVTATFSKAINPASINGTTFTVSPGATYKASSTLALSVGNVTLDAQGNANAVFIFQVGSTLTTSASTQVVLAGGAQAKNIFWQVGSSATLGTSSVFKGNILALASITMTGVNLEGKALARTAAVTDQQHYYCSLNV
jgi:hypothetical protein